MNVFIRRRVPAAFVILYLLFVLACAEKPAPAGPGETVTGYLEALFSGAFEDMDAYRTPGDRGEPAGTPPFETRFLRRYLARLVSFRVEEAAVERNRAEVRVIVTEPDFRAVLHDLEKALASGEGPVHDLEVYGAVTGNLGSQAAIYRKEGVPGRSYRVLFHLARMGGSWKIVGEESIGR